MNEQFEPSRIQRCFAKLSEKKRCALVAFLTAGDPDLKCSERLFERLADSSVDLLEIGMPFSDPVADGEAIQKSSKRALLQGVNIVSTLELAARLRAKYADLPIVLMGYVNPIHRLGLEKFARLAQESGVDGVILVDLPPEEDAPYIRALRAAGIALIRLATPTSNDERLETICSEDFKGGAGRAQGGFLYVVSVAGTTGRKQAAEADLQSLAQRLRKHTSLPLVAGFGVRSPEQVAMFARYFDGVVVGSALVEEVAASQSSSGNSPRNSSGNSSGNPSRNSCKEASSRLQQTIARLQQGLASP